MIWKYCLMNFLKCFKKKKKKNELFQILSSHSHIFINRLENLNRIRVLVFICDLFVQSVQKQKTERDGTPTTKKETS